MVDRDQTPIGKYRINPKPSLFRHMILTMAVDNLPKFPSTHQLSFLLRRYYQTKDPQTLAMVEKTLTQMRLGGIYDQLGFDFHRYSTDAQWLVPHFEKL